MFVLFTTSLYFCSMKGNNVSNKYETQKSNH